MAGLGVEGLENTAKGSAAGMREWYLGALQGGGRPGHNEALRRVMVEQMAYTEFGLAKR